MHVYTSGQTRMEFLLRLVFVEFLLFFSWSGKLLLANRSATEMHRACLWIACAVCALSELQLTILVDKNIRSDCTAGSGSVGARLDRSVRCGRSPSPTMMHFEVGSEPGIAGFLFVKIRDSGCFCSVGSSEALYFLLDLS